jgi:hypothetical protein
VPAPTPPPGAPTPVGRTILWPAAGAVFVGIGIIAYRIATLPESRLAAFAVGGAIALIITGVVLGFGVLSIRRRMSAAAAAFPHAVLVPVTVGPATATPFRWLATETGTAALRLNPSSYATIAFDEDGLHLVKSPRGPFGDIPAASVTVKGESSTLLGARSMATIVLAVEAGDDTIEVPFVPMRLNGNPLRQLTPEERHDVMFRIKAALRGETVVPGWEF